MWIIILVIQFNRCHWNFSITFYYCDWDYYYHANTIVTWLFFIKIIGFNPFDPNLAWSIEKTFSEFLDKFLYLFNFEAYFPRISRPFSGYLLIIFKNALKLNKFKNLVTNSLNVFCLMTVKDWKDSLTVTVIVVWTAVNILPVISLSTPAVYTFSKFVCEFLYLFNFRAFLHLNSRRAVPVPAD